MTDRWRVVAALVLTASACSRHTAPPLAPDASALAASPVVAESAAPPATTAAPRPTPTGPVDTFLGGSAQVVWRTRKDGNLWIFVERVRRANGTVVTTVTYQRSKYCASHGEDFGCAVVWTQKRRIPNRSFVIDTSLRAASLRDTLFGQPVRVTWRPFGTPTTQVNENGSRYMHSRDAAADTTWGPMHYVERENIEASMIYHRIADAAKS